ncbi:MAG: ADP-ribosylglycohydrolase family protein, partial [Parachlamydiaceae bacterium]|nr:ADP-ribosylglycohydrolase family protein [Parachlamydiaceae bacterium]
MLELNKCNFVHFSFLSKNEKKEIENQIKTLDQVSQLIFGCLALGAVGDTLGFGSGHRDPKFLNKKIIPWELCGKSELIQQIIQQNYGHYRNIHFRSPKGEQAWVVSDDTILHFMQAEVIALNYKNDMKVDQIIQEIAKKHALTLEYQINQKKNERCFGCSTRRTWRQFTNDPINWKNAITFNSEATGCAGSMRGMVFGLLFPGSKNEDKLIESVVNAAFLTNPSLISVLGTLASASFASFSLSNIPINEWLPELKNNFLKTYEYLDNLKNQENLPQNYRNLIINCLDEVTWSHIIDCWQF